METHRRLAPCPAALEDRELGSSTGIEAETEDREECGHNRTGEGGLEFWSLGWSGRTGGTLGTGGVSFVTLLGHN